MKSNVRNKKTKRRGIFLRTVWKKEKEMCVVRVSRRNTRTKGQFDHHYWVIGNCEFLTKDRKQPEPPPHDKIKRKKRHSNGTKAQDVVAVVSEKPKIQKIEITHSIKPLELPATFWLT